MNDAVLEEIEDVKDETPNEIPMNKDEEIKSELPKKTWWKNMLETQVMLMWWIALITMKNISSLIMNQTMMVIWMLMSTRILAEMENEFGAKKFRKA